MYEIDWTEAPEWAMWHAFDEDGWGYFHECKPIPEGRTWKTEGGLCKATGPREFCRKWKETLTQRPAHASTQPKKHPHYHKHTNGAETIDVYWVLNAWEVDCHAVGHAVKKLLNAGQRGAKSKRQDLQEAIDSIQRAIELEQSQ